MILVSACLAGLACRYDGRDNAVAWIRELVAAGQALPFCPEQLGGLGTPREPAEQRPGHGREPKVHSLSGQDLTGAFLRGARESLKLARLIGADAAILKERSPSCGVHAVYNGRFEGILVPGEGLTARLFREAGISLYCEDDETLWKGRGPREGR